MTPPLQDLIDRLDRLPCPGDDLGQDMREAISAAGRDSVSCAIRARRVLEHVVRDVFQRRVGEPSGTRPFENILARVVKDGHFPEELAGFVGAVKGMANRVAHDTNRTYPAEYLIPALDQVLLVLEWYFEHERPVSGVGSHRPPSGKPPPSTEPAAMTPRPSAVGPSEPGRKALVQLAVQGKKFSMSCSVALGLMMAAVLSFRSITFQLQPPVIEDPARGDPARPIPTTGPPVTPTSPPSPPLIINRYLYYDVLLERAVYDFVIEYRKEKQETNHRHPPSFDPNAGPPPTPRR